MVKDLWGERERMSEERQAVVKQSQDCYWDLDLDSCTQKKWGVYHDLLCFGKVHYGSWLPIQDGWSFPPGIHAYMYSPPTLTQVEEEKLPNDKL